MLFEPILTNEIVFLFFLNIGTKRNNNKLGLDISFYVWLYLTNLGRD